jgi:hypothetical protein
MFFKFMIVSFVGVVFQDSQIAGTCVAWLMCCAIMAFFAFQRPYLYSGGNYLSVASYGSLLAAFTAALNNKLAHDGYVKVVGAHVDFQNLLFLTWLMPYALVVADMLNAPYYFMKCVERFSKLSCRRGRTTAWKPAVAGAAYSSSRINASFNSEHSRRLYILSTIESLLPIVCGVIHEAETYAIHVRAKETKMSDKRAAGKTPTSTSSPPTSAAWDSRKSAATMVAAKVLDAGLCTMIDAFSNGGGEASSSLTGNYRPLYWQHFVDVEEAASKLSQIAFPFTEVCRRKHLSSEKGKPGFERLAFVNRHVLWTAPITRQLQQVQEGSRRVKAMEREHVGEDGDATHDTGHHPNVKDIRVWREVVVALLKPHADFGWHGHRNDNGISSEEKTLRESSLSVSSFSRRGEHVTEGSEEKDAALHIEMVDVARIQSTPVDKCIPSSGGGDSKSTNDTHPVTDSVVLATNPTMPTSRPPVAGTISNMPRDAELGDRVGQLERSLSQMHTTLQRFMDSPSAMPLSDAAAAADSRLPELTRAEEEFGSGGMHDKHDPLADVLMLHRQLERVGSNRSLSAGRRVGGANGGVAHGGTAHGGTAHGAVLAYEEEGELHV